MVNKKKNILVLASTFPRWKNDTVPEFVLDLSKNLSHFHKVVVLAPHDKGAKFKEKFDNIHIYRFPYFLPNLEILAYRGGMINAFKKSILAKIEVPFFLLSQFIFASYIILKYKIDLIHAHWLFPQGFTASLLKLLFHKKAIVTTHGGDIAILKSSLMSSTLKPSVKQLDLLTFVSNTNKNQFTNAYSDLINKKLHILPMGINLPKKVPHMKNTHHQKILFIGRLVEIKGLDLLLKSLPTVLKKYPNIHLDILGDGPFKDDWINLAKSLNINNHVTFHGFISGPTKSNFLQNTDIVVVPSIIDKYGYEEGLPVVALEALAAGKILIATKTGGLVDLITESNGVLIEPNSQQAIASALLQVLSPNFNRKKVQTNALKTAEQYTWHEIVHKFNGYLNEIYD